MQKPVNKFALFVWIVSVLLFITDIPATLALKQMFKEASYPGNPALAFAVSWQNVWMYVRSATISSLQLASFGVLIELLDKIRWNALPPEARVSTHKSRWFRFLRNWPHSTGN